VDLARVKRAAREVHALCGEYDPIRENGYLLAKSSRDIQSFDREGTLIRSSRSSSTPDWVCRCPHMRLDPTVRLSWATENQTA
jgi:hypothetical protein